MKRIALVVAFIIGWSVAALGQAQSNEYEVGGPLAGLKLPRDPNMITRVQLYPDSVEQYRAYMTKYVPVRSFFDRQSLLKNWIAPNIPGGAGARVEEYASPVYRQPDNGVGTPTGAMRPPVPVIRCGVKNPVFQLDLGTLDPGLYAVRVVGAVETQKLRRFREPIYLAMSVNDGLANQVSTYRMRIGYVDEFYSVAEIYFHAPAKHPYRAALWVDSGSTLELLVHNVTLDDVLAGTIRRALKTKTTLHEPAAQAIRENLADPQRRTSTETPTLTPQERLARDEAIWKWLPPLNAQGQWLDMNVPIPGVTYQHPKDDGESGAWEPEGNTVAGLGGVLAYDARQYNYFLINKKLNLRYTIDDLWAHKVLPDPYLFKDDGAGLYFPDPAAPQKGNEFSPIAKEVGTRLRSGFSAALGGAYTWRRSGNADIAHDAAVALVRFAYQYPAIDAANWTACVTVIPSAYDRDLRCRMREECSRWMPHYESYLLPVIAYDALFDHIKGNEELAASIRRFVPWVRNSEDVVMLLDVYLVQTEARRIMRYHDHTKPMAISEVATSVGDTKVTDPWMDWLFTRTFMYPMDPCGIQDAMITACDRNGPQYIGSTYYAQGEGAAVNAAGLERYMMAGGNPKYDLTDAQRYPKPGAQCTWQLNTVVGGMDFARIGDVCGPDKSPGATLDGAIGAARNGWRWMGDPRFAWILANVTGGTDERNEEWSAIQKAAAAVARAPWLDNRSRQLYNWFGVLESGLQHDDYRFRRAVYVRTGLGTGHQHADTLDLQVIAHGMPMTFDDGQRSGYCKPNSRFSRIHNVVEVNGQGNEEFGLRSQAWVQAISDAPGAQYLRAKAVPPNGSRLFERQVALLDVDEGQGSRRVPIAQQRNDPRLPRGVTTPNSYVFDVFRVSGGKAHTYCFHGPIEDEFQWNVKGEQAIEHIKSQYSKATDAEYLSLFERLPDKKFAGDCPATLEATWRSARQGRGSEQQMLRSNYDPAAPRKFTRLHLLGADGMRGLRAGGACEQTGIQYQYTALMAQRKADAGDLESAFAAIIEPYAGDPFIAGQRLLPVADNEQDALRAVAVEVKTTNKHTDICFADGRPQTTRRIPDAGVQVAGEFAYVSSDAEGLRLASLSGGTLLEAAGVKIAVSVRERTAKVTQVDYLKRTFTIDAVWPMVSTGRLYEIGSPERTTSYMATSVAPEANASTITLQEGADYYRSPVLSVNGDRVHCVLGFSLGRMKGLEKNWVASNDDLTKFWRAEHVGGNDFRPTGAPVTMEDFAPANALRLWEYGVGDTLRQSTFASVRRVAANEYEVTGDVDVEVTLAGKTHKVTVDELAKNGGAVRVPCAR
jgi:hypothetical protein